MHDPQQVADSLPVACDLGPALELFATEPYLSAELRTLGVTAFGMAFRKRVVRASALVHYLDLTVMRNAVQREREENYLDLSTSSGSDALHKAVRSACIIVGTWPSSVLPEIEVLEALTHRSAQCLLLLLFQRHADNFTKVRNAIPTSHVFFASARLAGNPAYRRLGIALNCTVHTSLQLALNPTMCSGDGMPRKWASLIVHSYCCLPLRIVDLSSQTSGTARCACSPLTIESVCFQKSRK
eukprot:3489211-Amphidinium_carterae.1